ncbi:hypothetical protein BV25DRAFT_1841605 [Artomyces pyxidatus]|uniref:Uncharacterized protein n=1 Tax=Artomyces pyxidatus TaxID=48021 RepID=A0ACB8SLV2_9AGAM|nr:hypothetical protein BV25DRAFT_1841605 [Artomyces pyxidatus]
MQIVTLSKTDLLPTGTRNLVCSTPTTSVVKAEDAITVIGLCQSLAWKAHKARCGMTAEGASALQTIPRSREVNERLRMWLRAHKTLLYQFALWAMNLANEPYDVLCSHSVVIHVQEKRSITAALVDSEPPDIYNVVGGAVVEDTILKQDLQRLGYPEDALEAMADMFARDHFTCQIAVICEEASIMRLLWFTLSEHALDLLRRMGPDRAADLHHEWVMRLTTQVRTGFTSLAADSCSMAKDVEGESAD